MACGNEYFEEIEEQKRGGVMRAATSDKGSGTPSTTLHEVLSGIQEGLGAGTSWAGEESWKALNVERSLSFPEQQESQCG